MFDCTHITRQVKKLLGRSGERVLALQLWVLNSWQFKKWLQALFGIIYRGVATGGARASPKFGRPVNPIQTRGQIVPLTLLPAPEFKKLSTFLI